MSLLQELEALSSVLAVRRSRGVQDAIDRQIAALRETRLDEQALAPTEYAPDFDLPDLASGRMVSLDDLLSSLPVALVFVRGFWCPYCSAALRALDRIAPEIHDAGAALVAITVEPAAQARAALAAAPLRFPILHDWDTRVSALFGLTFQLGDELAALYRAAQIAFARDESGRILLPIPASYVVRRDGIVAWSHVDVDFTRRAEPQALLAAVNALNR
jgi:peroxiredoxin